MSLVCGDCGCQEGQLHELFCTKERCPFCGTQLVSCTCISEVLKLTHEEQAALDAYEDDSIEPLLGINKRWVSALQRKGRIPF